MKNPVPFFPALIFLFCALVSFCLTLHAQPALPPSPLIHRSFERTGHGNDFRVEITIITQTHIQGFARYSEELTPGDSITPEKNGNSSARFDGGKTKFVWTSYPDVSELHLSYILHVKNFLVTNYPGELRFIADGTSQTVMLKREDSILSEH